MDDNITATEAGRMPSIEAMMRMLRRIHQKVGPLPLNVEWTLSTPVLNTLLSEQRPEHRINLSNREGAIFYEGYPVNEVETNDIVIYLTSIDPR